MITTSRPVKLACVLLAASAHAALALALMTNDPVRTEGAPGSADVQLGTAFADMAAGVMTADAVDTVVQPDNTADPLAQEQAALAAPAPPELNAPEKATETPSEKPLDAPKSAPVAKAPQTPSQPALTVPVAPVSPRSTLQAAKPAEVEPLSPDTAPTETIEEESSHASAVARSLRPMARSRELEETAKREAEAKQRAEARKAPARQKAAPKRGNAKQNARAGATTGTRNATSKSSGAGGASANASGNAAASNYPGVVMSCVSRSGRPNVRGRGTARVSFNVAGNGRITNVGLARSSGNAALDRASVDLVRRVGACPPPPAGARRTFSIGVSAR